MFSIKDTQRVKGVAILLLLFHHLFFTEHYITKYNLAVSEEIQHYLIPVGVMARVCVWIFLFLSAYGLCIRYNELKLSNSKFVFKYLVSSIKNLLFIYIITFVIIFCIVSKNPMLVKEYYGQRWSYMIFDMLGWADLFQTPTLNGVWWYMTLTEILIIFIPILVEVIRKYGAIVLPILFIIINLVDCMGIVTTCAGPYKDYILGAVLGVWCANNRVFDKILTNKSKKYNLIMGSLVLLVIALTLYWRYKFYTYSDVRNMHGLLAGISAMLICLFVVKWMKVKWIAVPLEFLGKYSMNMYLMHTVLYNYFPKMIFWTRNAGLVYVTLVCFSLIVSIAIEFIKNKTKYNQLFKIITIKVIN